MELALYCPVYGYYEKEEDRIGRAGDYYTSVSVGSLFGELLAWQFAEWLGEDGAQIVEAGAHRGELARDILNWLRINRARLFERLEYIVVEPSVRRREWQRRTLGEFGRQVRWLDGISQLVGKRSELSGGVSGVMFSNELLDAMPVHRLGWEAQEGRWFAWGVTSKEGQFTWTRIQPEEAVNKLALERVGALREALPDGFILELCPAAEKWWAEAAAVLSHGRLLTIDYGFNADELLRPERHQGTLRAYYQHRLTEDLLARPGEQDITAHVNFDALQRAGEAAGLKTELFTTQARLLTNIASRGWKEGGSFEWTNERKRQFQTLTHPEHLGERFRVLAQSRDGGSKYE